MKLLTATAISLFLLSSASAYANEATSSSGSGARPAASSEHSQSMIITRNGSQPSNKGAAQYFTGSVRVDSLFQAKDPSRTSGTYVTFEPGVRSAWHTHPLGQTLIVTAGTGWVQQEGGEKREIKPGDVIWTPPGVKHWHGATATNGMTHLAFYSGWANAMSAVAKDVFGKRGVGSDQLPPASGELLPIDEAAEAPRAARVEQDGGPVAPGVVQYTSDVLFHDLWLRPALAPRDRSLVTVSALIASGQVAQIPYHLNRAMDNGPTKAQASEVLTHLAFYAGWPNVFSAIPVAKDVFEKCPS